MRLLVDENLSPLHTRTLRSLGCDAVSVLELGLSGAEDEAVRNMAIECNRILVTLDADFGNVLRFPPAESPGVIRLRVHPATEAAIDAVLRTAMPCLAEIDIAGKLVIVDGERIRVRG